MAAAASAAPDRGRTIRAKLVVDRDHYADLVAVRLREAKVSVWIATANLKSTLVEAPVGTRARARGRFVSLYEALGELAKRGVEVRILHASPPSRPLAREMTKDSGVTLRQCPRVHLKMVAIDGRHLYLGSANLTGAGLGAKGEGRRNFEMGILTDSDALLDDAQERFDRIWRGAECGSCKLRASCPRPLDLPTTSAKGSRRARRAPPAPR